MFKNLVVLYTNVYAALIYGIYSSSFELVPFVYGPLYGFKIRHMGVVFTSILWAASSHLESTSTTSDTRSYRTSSNIVPVLRNLDCDQR